jgi:hypothetical protein
LNPRPSDYKSDALPAELRQPCANRVKLSHGPLDCKRGLSVRTNSLPTRHLSTCLWHVHVQLVYSSFEDFAVADRKFCFISRQFAREKATWSCLLTCSRQLRSVNVDIDECRNFADSSRIPKRPKMLIVPCLSVRAYALRGEGVPFVHQAAAKPSSVNGLSHASGIIAMCNLRQAPRPPEASIKI